jgi:hypothetical protein
MSENIHDLGDYLCKQVKPTEAESLKTEHVIREKVTINPERRKLLRIVGVFGKDEKQLKEESGLNDFFFKFSTSLTGPENHRTSLRFQPFNRKVF